MDQNIANDIDGTGARAPMTNASERYNTCLWEDFFPTPPIRGFSTVGFHRRVSDGAGAARFYTIAFLWVGGLTGEDIIFLETGGLCGFAPEG